MLVWCLSGVVMLFVRYPDLGEGQRLRGLDPIAWDGCCRFGVDGALAGATPIVAASVEALDGAPLLRMTPAGGEALAIDLRTGRRIERFDATAAAAVARAFGRRTGAAGNAAAPEPVVRDQWTVAGDFNHDRPLQRVALGDPRGTEVYVSSASGKVVQITDAPQRFWNWLGAVPHWLYPSLLRQHTALWTQVVIWTSVLGIFLTGSGLWAGWLAFRPCGDARWSAYRGVWLWHHLAGLVCGVLTLAWVASGLVSMNPWGLLEGGSDDARARLQGAPPAWSQVRAAVQDFAAERRAPSVVQLSIAPLGGRLFLLARTEDGGLQRMRADGAPAPMQLPELSAAAARITAPASPASQDLLRWEDAYWFSHHQRAKLPVYRVVAAGPAATRYYLDPETGALLGRFDPDARGYRWLHEGLHRWDFVPGLGDGPLWAALMVVLLSGVTAGVGTGVWMSWKAVGRDLRRIGRRKGQRQRQAQAPPRP